MTKNEMLSLLVEDLKNEYTHMLFYLAASATIRGLHRLELGEWLEKEAESEMGHVKEFSKLLVSLGGIPATEFHLFPTLTDPVDIIKKAIELEQEVCVNYAQRLDQLEFLKSQSNSSGQPMNPEEYAAWTRVGLFYEGQLEHSHTDLDELRQWLPIIS